MQLERSQSVKGEVVAWSILVIRANKIFLNRPQIMIDGTECTALLPLIPIWKHFTLNIQEYRVVNPRLCKIQGPSFRIRD